MFLRAYKICDVEFLDREITHINKVFQGHGYSQRFIDKGHSKSRKIFYGNHERKPFLDEEKSLLVLPQTQSNNSILNQYLTKCNITAVFKNTNTVKKYLKKKEPLKDDQSCIYEIPCKDCPKKYIGKTIDFNRRKREHKDAVKKCNENSAIFHHLQSKDHVVDISGMKVVKSVNNVEKR